jgi:hypothetical protein
MARLLTLASFLLMAVGLVIAWPLVRAAVQFRPVSGHIMEVITLPAEGERIQLAIAYEYPLPQRGERAIGYALSDGRLQPVGDPVVDASEANALLRALRPGRPVRIYYDVNHPIDSAFMLSPVSIDGRLRPEHGALLVMIGLAFGILGQLARRAADRGRR